MSILVQCISLSVQNAIRKQGKFHFRHFANDVTIKSCQGVVAKGYIAMCTYFMISDKFCYQNLTVAMYASLPLNALHASHQIIMS